MENVGPLLNKCLVIGDTEKAEVLDAFCASVLTAKTTSQESHTMEVKERVGRMENSSCLRKI